MESSKMYYPSRCRYRTYQCGAANYPISWVVGSIRPRMEICVTSSLPIPVLPRLHQTNGNIKTKLQAWRVQKCIAPFGVDTVLTSAGPQITPFHGG